MFETSEKDITAAQNGDKIALDQIIENNKGLIWNIVKRFKDRGYEVEDLFQIGCIGFIKAIKRFSFEYKVKLSTYAVPSILGEIKRFLRDDGPIKVSRSIKELAYKIYIFQKEHLDKTGQEIGIMELAKKLNTSKEEVAVALESVRCIESIDQEETNEGDGKTTLINRLSTNSDESKEVVDKLAIKQLINDLQDNEKEIILLRYYKEKTQMEVAKILNISQVQVCRIEKKALYKMKQQILV